MKLKLSFLVSLCVLFLGHSGPLLAEVNVNQILKKVDQLFRSDSSESDMEMTIETPHWKRKLAMKIYSKGLEETFVRILSPKKDKGISTLRKGKEMWNYFPKVNKVIKVSPSLMTGSWMGSDFTNDDLVKQTTLENDYTSKLIQSSSEEHYQIELTPKQDTVSVWGKIILIVNKKTLIPLEESYFNEKGDKIRSMYFKDVKKYGNKDMPSVIEIVSHKKQGNKTRVHYKTAVFNQAVKKNIFTLRNLKKN